eukprot:1948472-Amphidinium_carterae.1
MAQEFHALLLNIFWFNKLWQIFDNAGPSGESPQYSHTHTHTEHCATSELTVNAKVDTGNDRRMDVNEFMNGMNRLGLSMSPAEVPCTGVIS